MKVITVLLLFFYCVVSGKAWSNEYDQGDDGYRLWLNYTFIENDTQRLLYLRQIANVQLVGQSDTISIIDRELKKALPTLLGNSINWSTNVPQSNGLIISKANSTLRHNYKLDHSLKMINNEGFIIKTVTDQKQNQHVLVTAKSDIGLLYGTYRLIQLMQTGKPLSDVNIVESPKIALRMLNHWDDLDRHTERGYAGESIWDWHKLPQYKEQRYFDYARANASIGINGTVVNNVNANSLILTPAWLEKVRSLADIFRPYGIKIYLSIKFSSPQQIGNLSTSDPIDPNVQKWWQGKAAEIYKLIPDFGGFLVKANSEGQPGPGDYGRTHAQGANMLAKALQPYGGNVIWRAFVYSHEEKTERSLQAYNEFVPLDGQFEKNVSIQVKNGPIDFQPREPFSPMFGAMPKTPLAMEFQITQEYLGFSTHLAYLATLYKEVLDADTRVKGIGSTVAKIIDGTLVNKNITAIAGVANIGSDRNWTGHIFGQANWYAYGRLAWDHDLTADEIAQDWIKMTLTQEQSSVNSITNMMMRSRENIVNYMTPLGLHHLMDTGHHYGPGPWVDNLGRDDWNPVYYHRADDYGIGLDRTSKGTNAVSQYATYWQTRFEDPAKTPQPLLLWFHHLPWDYTMPSGDTLWNELVKHYYRGVVATEQMEKDWLAQKNHIAPHQFNQVKMALEIQVEEAKWWRDACVLYFQTYSKRPLPNGLSKPDKSLDYFKSLTFPYAPGQG
ncbi:alpha-glucuronidase family glycosyl hydrolase [Psychrosphaera sp. 1_MG-2023]|uniref:alpha-glucuronidase family glycosyl hydrolase n=1 Tax=Psychrosphaera sp. 1_MG-2023 TaxID=3062643 RepID=UPI0026E31BD9|nr:alpha-glucuronidase family glycosyl hydrolase [Psychrosphaera sp. 1_MG-2023]MDO6718661.1 alpha-glucuronidase family glycosyl hydrolase [Psychrosphaera sp. 1_MG-2023]